MASVPEGSTPVGAGRRLFINFVPRLHSSAGRADKTAGFGSMITCLGRFTTPLPVHDESTGILSRSMNHRHGSASYVSDRAKLYVPLMLAISLTACARDRISPVYDAAGTIRRLDYDTNGDGHTDMRAYLENGQTVRIEADGDADGVVDRWEYYGADSRLERLGTSSESDGVEDTWVIETGNQMRVDVATQRDGIVDRREFHDSGVLVRAEQDTNRDGRPDQWQRFTNGKLRELLMDTSLSAGHPDRRLLYGPDGSVQRLDSDV